MPQANCNQESFWIGVNDLPISPQNSAAVSEEDKLRIASYFEGLAEFIQRTVTPMTIAVQGSWGSGKTSTLKSVEAILTNQRLPEGKSAVHPIPPVKIVSINTWQYALFSSDETLVFSILNNIVASLADEQSLSQKLTQVAQFEDFRKLAKTVQNGVWKLCRTGLIAAAATQGVDLQPTLHLDEQVKSNSESLSDLKKSFEDLVKKYCTNMGVSKVVFFIDDLDRLEPAMAVELLEVFKVLLDVPNTVFVLAVDFDIVKLGIEQRYSIGNRSQASQEWKARSFFDKIVQVPFNMPVTSYDPTDLIKEQLDLTIQKDDELLQKYKDAVLTSVGSNPRAIKRLFNAFTLTEIIIGKRDSENATAKDKFPIFLLICMEVAYQMAYQAFSKAALLPSANREGELEYMLKMGEWEGFSDEEFEDWGIPENERQKFEDFLDILREEFLFDPESSSDDSGSEVELNLEKLRSDLRYSVVTSVSSEPSPEPADYSLESTVLSALVERGIVVEDVQSPEVPILWLERKIQEVVKSSPENYKRFVKFSAPGSTRSHAFSGHLLRQNSELRWRKFLEMKQDKTSLSIELGAKFVSFDLAQASQDWAEMTATEAHFNEIKDAYSELWQKVIQSLIDDPDIPSLDDEGVSSDSFGFSLRTSAPIAISNITSPEQVDRIMRHFDAIYHAANENISTAFGFARSRT